MFTLVISLIFVKTYIRLNLISQKLKILHSFKTETVGMLPKFFGIIMSLKI